MIDRVGSHGTKGEVGAREVGPRPRFGYTLVELMIAVSIVGILAALGASQYTRYIERTLSARAIVELRNLAAEIEIFGAEGKDLPASLASVDLEKEDPWGNPYRYLLIQGELPPGMSAVGSSLPHVAAPGGGGGGGGGGPPAIALARKDRFLVPINSDFDLYSMGPDGESKATLNNPRSRDDIIRAADGGFFGIAENF